MSYDNANEVANEFFDSFLSRYHIGLETSMRRSDFIFESVQTLFCKCRSINFKRGGSYFDSPDWIKKKATINPKITDDKCFQYAVSVALKYREIKWNPERVWNIKPLINKHNWKETNYPSKIDDWKTFEKNVPIIALNILYMKEKEAGD